MTPEQRAREVIDRKLLQSGWIIQDVKSLNPMAAMGVTVREFPTSTGEVDYALFVEGVPVGVVEAKKSEAGEDITAVEKQSAEDIRNSSFKSVECQMPRAGFAYEATDRADPLHGLCGYQVPVPQSLFCFTGRKPSRRCSKQPNTLRNNMKHFPPLDTTGFRQCQITAIQNLERFLRPQQAPRARSNGDRRRQDVHCHHIGLSAFEVWQDEPRPLPSCIPAALANRQNANSWPTAPVMIPGLFRKSTAFTG